MTERHNRILVTACGGDIGFSVGRILMADTTAHVLGSDTRNTHPGLALFEECVTLPPASSPSYLSALHDAVSRNDVSLVLPISEPELEILSQSDERVIGDTGILTPSAEAVHVGLDKQLTAVFLALHNIPGPWTVPADGEPIAYPCIAKPRRGRGSKGIAVLESEEDLACYSFVRDEYVFQEMLVPADEEYTCGVFRSATGEVRTIAFKRVLQGGLTGEGTVVRIRAIDDMLSSIAEHLELVGSINVQLRLTTDGPRVFEINPRFSSTVYFRHLLGFEDVLWSLRDHYGQPIGAYTAPAEGTRFYRVSNEIVLPPI